MGLGPRNFPEPRVPQGRTGRERLEEGRADRNIFSPSILGMNF
jgi:hypothetical protein